MGSERNVGYAFLAVGAAMIFISVSMVFIVFMGFSSPPVLVDLSNVSLVVPIVRANRSLVATSPNQTGLISVVAGENLSRMVAMAFWYVFMFFVMWAGGKLGSMGVDLIKETIAEVKETASITPVREEGVELQGGQDIEDPLYKRDRETENTHRNADEDENRTIKGT